MSRWLYGDCIASKLGLEKALEANYGRITLVNKKASLVSETCRYRIDDLYVAAQNSAYMALVPSQKLTTRQCLVDDTFTTFTSGAVESIESLLVSLK